MDGSKLSIVVDLEDLPKEAGEEKTKDNENVSRSISSQVKFKQHSLDSLRLDCKLIIRLQFRRNLDSIHSTTHTHKIRIFDWILKKFTTVG